ncbi:DUF502 domain-containing protein [Carboxylicivirga mesophila]|uniref:DUF502 domain-containing protein n=1 Tax=Carboxylicivirga mesophila TaxID=1166478 RepID=A0ABS5KFA8_9BACT|nr:DUF502 domain-containing protein [Carboxylicivirga mesophila]MBS2213681.1 DUF502 domain-containing protein [Carboxylicivirga mesophila]
MKKLAKFFFQGLLYVVPLAVTIYVIVFAFIWLDGLLRDLEVFQHEPYSQFNFPGLGLLVIILCITFIGFIGQILITAPIENRFERGLKKAPLIKVIYTSVKDLLSAFVGKERKFERPVLVTLDKEGIMERFGFITASDLNELGIKNKLAVYLPSSYGILGELYVVPSENVKPIDAHPADVMKFIVSGGVAKVK